MGKVMKTRQRGEDPQAEGQGSALQRGEDEQLKVENVKIESEV